MKQAFLLAFIVMLSCSSDKQISFAKFDTHKQAQPNSSAAAMQSIEFLKNRKDTLPFTLVFPKARYDFRENGAFTQELYISNHDQDNPKKVAFFIENQRNITIDGQGSEFVFHGRMIPFVLKNCRNVTFKNFSVDFELPHFRQLNVLEVNRDANEMLVEVFPQGNYKIVDNKFIAMGEGYEDRPFLALAFRADKRLTYIRRDLTFKPQVIEEQKPNVLKIKGWDQIGETTAGERFAILTGLRPTPGIVIDFCTNTNLQNIRVHNAEGMGLLAQMSENIHLNGFSVCLKGDNDPRYFTTQADATHFSACKGLILSENGLYEGMADDAINVHGTYLKITKIIDNQTVYGQYMHRQAYGFLWGEAGNEVQFIESSKMELVGNKTFKIQSIRPIDKPTAIGAKEYEIKLTEPLPAEITEQGAFGIENLTWTPEVIFRDNIIRNNRARGALFSTPRKVLCENNLFDHTHGTAILLCGDCNGWYETGACRDVTIRNNTFINALTANYQFTNAIISIYPEIPDLKGQQRFFHSGIVIEGNKFDTFDRPLLYAKSVDGLIFRNNTITHNTEFEPFHWNKYPFFFERVQNVTIENNQFDRGFKPEADLKVELSNKEAITIK